jgi:hypothetical protein
MYSFAGDHREKPDLEIEFQSRRAYSPVVLQLQQIADSDLARSLDSLSVALNPTEFTCPRRERPRLEE